MSTLKWRLCARCVPCLPAAFYLPSRRVCPFPMRIRRKLGINKEESALQKSIAARFLHNLSIMDDYRRQGRVVQAIACARPMIGGMVRMEKRVESETMLTDRLVSQSYRVANMVVVAATGALAEITQETNSVPRMPHK